tara:strand:+ start:1533 stop:1721 length:189 start_codon:yes stop_codon:yes gene_type:complete
LEIKTNKNMKEIYTKREFFQSYAPQFNFELDENQLIDKGLELGFITEVNNDRYLINQDYNKE